MPHIIRIDTLYNCMHCMVVGTRVNCIIRICIDSQLCWQACIAVAIT